MPRFTSQGWWCWCKQKNSPDSRKCSKCGANRFERHAQVHASERAVVYYNPVTGEHRTPARNDMMMPEQYVKDGFERREIMSMTQWEKESGAVHEATNFNSGNEIIPMEPPIPQPDPKVVHELATEIARAAASGPWTDESHTLEKLI